ncbi:monofunctional biosynthetic peptidoglycan transglycosylase [Marinicella sp. S1101]|uniref:monofunctional biosynthetic peptidoglycan transglycosylase n=1 Tax=Marinicella marina TaxID=2996016 RepID=UPI002260CA53|nr:monofunctional biosynthetic peptidoglycan transglycosylase [Marinicella marina]MCX7552471.1 monofunctional biosynthetic peptidoglycan transglycosylase [Marinicella marina]MDJ1139347.1 monofunctional biosynthetic peptidoglycan transglycosylase [Marinicella marina]
MTKNKKRTFLAKMRRWLVSLLLVWLVVSLSSVLALRWLDPPTTAFMLQRQYSSEYETIRLQYLWRDMSQISPQLSMSVIASEDQKFADHWGFDVGAIEQVIKDRQAGKKMRGASTISQQLAKNLFLWSGRSWVRKGLEVYFTTAIEAIIPKQRILELYLNVVEFGDGVYGAEAAAQSIFGVDAKSLDANQAALLAARLPAPKRYQIKPPSDYMQQRARWIQKQAKQLGGEDYLYKL